LTINFSAILERIGVTEIGRKSENEAGCDNLGTGVTIAVSHDIGTMPVLNEQLKISAI